MKQNHFNLMIHNMIINDFLKKLNVEENEDDAKKTHYL